MEKKILMKKYVFAFSSPLSLFIIHLSILQAELACEHHQASSFSIAASLKPNYDCMLTHLMVVHIFYNFCVGYSKTGSKLEMC